jgi:MFS transporter, NNP family, nitrate/nitrite transporter
VGLAAPFLLGALLVLLMGGVFLLSAKEPPLPGPVRSGLVAPFRVFLTDGRAWALTLFYFLSFGGFVAMFLYLPSLLVGVHT